MVVIRQAILAILLAAPAYAETVEQFWDKMDREHADAQRNGNPDHDFAMAMVPLHRGAYDMARAYLTTGRDPALRAQAARIIAQSQETVRFLRGWQARAATSHR